MAPTSSSIRRRSLNDDIPVWMAFPPGLILSFARCHQSSRRNTQGCGLIRSLRIFSLSSWPTAISELILWRLRTDLGNASWSRAERKLLAEAVWSGEADTRCCNLPLRMLDSIWFVKNGKRSKYISNVFRCETRRMYISNSNRLAVQIYTTHIHIPVNNINIRFNNGIPCFSGELGNMYVNKVQGYMSCG